MPKKKEEIEEMEVVEEEREEVKKKLLFYKGYDIRWLKREAGENHPDKGLVKEYEELYGEV